jgi:hypothetical protein
MDFGPDTHPCDAFLPDVKPTASTAPVDGQSIAFPNSAGRSVPQFQGNAVPVGSTAVAEENLTASKIGTREN